MTVDSSVSAGETGTVHPISVQPTLAPAPEAIGSTSMSRKALREIQNVCFVGGLRRPARGLQQESCAQLRSELQSVRAMIQGVMSRHTGCISSVAALLKGRSAETQAEAEALARKDLPQEAVDEAAKALALWAHASDHGPGRHTCLKVNLLQAVSRRLHDPDPGLVTALAQGVSLGTDSPLEPSGVFPPSDDAAPEEMSVLDEHCWDVVGRSWRNYPSAEQLQKQAASLSDAMERQRVTAEAES